MEYGDAKGHARPPHVVLVAATRAAAEGAIARAARFDANAWGGVAFLLGGLALALQAHLLALRLGDDIAWRWTVTLVPLWLVELALALFLVKSLFATHVVNSDSDADEAREGKINAFAALCLLGMLFASPFMFAQRADGTEEHSFFACAAPLYAGFGVVMLYGASLLYFNWPEDEVGAGGSGAMFIDTMHASGSV